jgi:hypothetical protein
MALAFAPRAMATARRRSVRASMAGRLAEGRGVGARVVEEGRARHQGGVVDVGAFDLAETGLAGEFGD